MQIRHRPFQNWSNQRCDEQWTTISTLVLALWNSHKLSMIGSNLTLLWLTCLILLLSFFLFLVSLFSYFVSQERWKWAILLSKKRTSHVLVNLNLIWTSQLPLWKREKRNIYYALVWLGHLLRNCEKIAQKKNWYQFHCQESYTPHTRSL